MLIHGLLLRTIKNVQDPYWDDVVQFGDYQRGANIYLKLILKVVGLVMDTDLGYVLIDLEPFWEAGKPMTFSVRQTQTEKDTGAILTITPGPAVPLNLTPHTNPSFTRPVHEGREYLPQTIKSNHFGTVVTKTG